MSCVFDDISGVYLPTFIATKSPNPISLTCACDMCYHPSFGIYQSIGPHDLHCVCYECSQFSLDEELYESCLTHRYPGWYDLLQIYYSSDSDTEDFTYPTPPNSPTNQEMHALNGNGDSTWGDFLQAGVRGAMGSSHEPDRYAAGLLASIGLLGSSMLYTAHSNMAKPLAELRDQLWPMGPTNKEMHAYNGNMDAIWDWVSNTNGVNSRAHDYYDVPLKTKIDKEIHDAEKYFLPVTENQKLHDFVGNTKLDSWQKGKNQFAKDAVESRLRKKIPIDKPVPSSVSAELVNHLNGVVDKIPALKSDPVMNQLIDQIKVPKPNVPLIKTLVTQVQETYPQIRTLGPTNKEMHAINGNIYGPANAGVNPKTHKNQLKRLAAKISKARFKAKRGGVKGKQTKIVINNRAGVAKARKPKGYKKALKQFKVEDRIAAKYTAFLKNPVFKPPPLGSTGETPVKLLHGFFETTFSMSSVLGLTNCTDLIAYISPKMFVKSTSATNYASPVTYGVAINAITNYENVASTSALAVNDFTNATALKNESGALLSTTAIPLVRFVGGHISVRCRCPMSTTAPPFLFGGLLPSQATSSGASTVVDVATQLSSLTGQAIRGLPSTVEIDGFEASSVYFPGSAKSLDFSNFVAQYNLANIDPTAIPYIGMTGCPTSANITIIASAWFEVQQTSTNQYYSGWQLGPKVSTEDIYDRLKRFPTVRPVSLNQGGKSNSGTRGAMFSLADFKKKEEVNPQQELIDLKSQLTELNKRVANLTVDVDDDDEKFTSVSSPDTPQYRNLSKSTIDLALQLKDKLTPGSVTSKTSRSSLP